MCHGLAFPHQATGGLRIAFMHCSYSVRYAVFKVRLLGLRFRFPQPHGITSYRVASPSYNGMCRMLSGCATIRKGEFRLFPLGAAFLPLGRCVWGFSGRLGAVWAVPLGAGAVSGPCPLVSQAVRWGPCRGACRRWACRVRFSSWACRLAVASGRGACRRWAVLGSWGRFRRCV